MSPDYRAVEPRPQWGEADIASDQSLGHYARMSDVTIDFIAFDEGRDAWMMVLVEEGPWLGSSHSHLTRLQDRLYGCLEAALDGQLADAYPDSRGKTVVVRVDCYDLPRDEIDGFIEKFSEGVTSLPDYSPASSPIVRDFKFEATHDTLTGG